MEWILVSWIWRISGLISLLSTETSFVLLNRRSTLDPFSEYSDESIWSALDRASMRTMISEAPAGLDTPVEEHGSNYSVGQR